MDTAVDSKVQVRMPAQQSVCTALHRCRFTILSFTRPGA